MEPGEQFWMIFGEVFHEMKPIMAEIKPETGGLKAVFSVTETSISIFAGDYCHEEPSYYEKCFQDNLKSELSNLSCTVDEYKVCFTRQGPKQH